MAAQATFIFGPWLAKDQWWKEGNLENYLTIESRQHISGHGSCAYERVPADLFNRAWAGSSSEFIELYGLDATETTDNQPYHAAASALAQSLNIDCKNLQHSELSVFY
jgi:hypothetical protein